MKLHKVLATIFALLFCAAILVGCTTPSQNQGSGTDGTYLVAVTLEGGSGRASVTSPAKVVVRGEDATATVEWSSPNYDYMIVDGDRYLPTNADGNSTFEIPVLKFDEPFEVIADTTAMSQPHEITYELTFDSASMSAAQ